MTDDFELAWGSDIRKRADIVTISKKRYVALMAAARALQDFWGFTQARGGEYYVVARQTMDALDALRTAGVEMGQANASAAAADPE